MENLTLLAAATRLLDNVEYRCADDRDVRVRDLWRASEALRDLQRAVDTERARVMGEKVMEVEDERVQKV